jgi:hypothetical protein
MSDRYAARALPGPVREALGQRWRHLDERGLAGITAIVFIKYIELSP